MTLNNDLDLRRQNAVPRGMASVTSVYAAFAENAEVQDVEGRRYIDFAGGIGVLNVGHRHPRVMSAVQAQLECYTHTAFTLMPFEPYVRLAERLNAIAPIEGEVKTAFFTTGAEATENAVKIARAATGRSGVIAFAGGFHGRTMLACAMTGKISPYKRSFGPSPPDIFHLPFPSEIADVSTEDTLKALDQLFMADIEPERVAAIIIEPVQGEGGFHPAPFDLMHALSERCARHGILLIADEVQSGVGRTGKMFAVEHCGVKPDIITVAKSLGGGFPIAGVIGRGAIMDAVHPGGLGGTYGGPPIAVAAAHAVLDVIADEGLLERAETIGERIRERLGVRTRGDACAGVANIRGLGAMIGFDIVNGGGLPDGDRATRICKRALEQGLLLLTCGQKGQAIRILVPLTISDNLLEEGLCRLDEVLSAEFPAGREAGPSHLLHAGTD